tara:strand:+ start:849 stop:1229 length:381 start_codon:yes stop_codon:yes gene_type:complete
MYLKAAFIVFLIFASAVFVFIGIQNNTYNNQIIKVQINLKNTCELSDEAFMVISYPEKKSSYFKDGTTSLFLKRSSKVQLAASNKFPGFHYSSIPIKVDKVVNLVSNCSNSDRLDNIFDSLNKQFN